MTRTASLDPDPNPLPTTLLLTWPAGPAERRPAFVVVLLSLLFFAAAAPFAKLPLKPVWAFIPIYESALIVTDSITALLLFGQFRHSRSRAVLVLGAGYLFSALATVAHGLSFPGLFTPQGLLSAGPQSTAWLYMFWHGGFPLFVVGYGVLRMGASQTMRASIGAGSAIAGACFAVVAVVAGFALLATFGHDALPPVMAGNHYTPTMIAVVSTVWAAGLLAIVVLWRHRPRSVLDLWLLVVMCAWLLDVALSAMLNAGRFDLGFYSGRLYGLLATSFVLGVLLLENGLLHTRLTQAHAHERRRATDLQGLSDRLELLNGQLGESNRQLKEQTRLKSEFLASMSHELRTPLNAVIGFSELLKDNMAGALSEQQRGFAVHIFQAGHHLLSLINDILDLSKIEAGKADISLGHAPLDSVFADALALLNSQASAKRIELKVDLRGDFGELLADQRRLKQVVLNLVSNALKFTPQGGQVTLGAELVDRTRAANALPGFREGMRMPLPASDWQRFVEISVSDTGIGMTPDDMRRLFTPFTQIANSLTRGIEGTGLGLVMVHRLAELHGGAVAVTSEPGRGTWFTVWIPWRTGATLARSIAAPDAVQPAKRPLALVVEDSDDAAALMQAQLEAEGFAVRRVASAEDALELASELTPNLITLDILLPGMDGWEFLAQLRLTARWEGVPVVVVSVVADQGRGFSLGAALVLQKPVGRDALIKGLERLGLTPQGHQRELTVLVIDDDADAVELLATHLRQRDYIVLRALGGREGIELARRFRPDLIALDLEMPEVNGFDVVEALKGNPSTAQIPIVVVTAKDLTRSDRERLNGHIRDIVGKAEFNHGRFIGEVQRALSRPAQAIAEIVRQ
jgi:signal transduction histidine kinase/CheY-like chemotaxis protein